MMPPAAKAAWEARQIRRRAIRWVGVCAALVLVIPGWREVVDLDARLAFRLQRGNTIVMGLELDCFLGSLMPVLDLVRGNESPNAAWQAVVDEMGREHPARWAVSSVIAVALNPRSNKTEEIRTLLHRTQEEDPGNGLLWFAEAEMLWRLPRDDGHPPESDDVLGPGRLEEATALVETALTKQPWGLHSREDALHDFEEWTHRGMPALEAATWAVMYSLRGHDDVAPLLDGMIRLIRGRAAADHQEAAWQRVLSMDAASRSVRWIEPADRRDFSSDSAPRVERSHDGFTHQLVFLAFYLCFLLVAATVLWTPSRRSWAHVIPSVLVTAAAALLSSALAARVIYPFFGQTSVGLDCDRSHRDRPWWSQLDHGLPFGIEMTLGILLFCWLLRGLEQRRVLWFLIAAGAFVATTLVALTAISRGLEADYALRILRG